MVYSIVLLALNLKEELLNIFKCQKKTSGVNYHESTLGVSTVTM